MGGCSSELSMEKQKSSKKKLGSWLKKLVHHKDKVQDHCTYLRVQELQHLAPLSTHSNRKKQHLATQQLVACHAQDDCGQQLASSDQEASQVARIEDQGLLSSYASEHYGSECSLSESVRAATAHMATLRSLLVNHITETHDARDADCKLTGPSMLEALQERQQQHAGSRSSSRPCSTSRLPSGSSGTDRRVHSLMADQMQLLDLVGTLIDDHRHCLLEQQRLREQLAAMQQKLHIERLDKDRVAALADVRSEEASKAQADLAVASAAVKQLHAKRAISSRRIQLPPVNRAAAAAAAQGSVRVSVSVLSDAEPDCSAAVHTLNSSGNHSAQAAGPKIDAATQPLAAGAAAAAPLGTRSSSTQARAAASSNSLRQAGSSSKGANGKFTSRQNPGSTTSSSRNSSRRNVVPPSAIASAPGQGQRVRQRRLLGGSSQSSSSKDSSAAGGAASAAADSKLAASSSSCGSGGGGQEQCALGDASVLVQVVQQQGRAAAAVAAPTDISQAAAGAEVPELLPKAAAAAVPSAAAKIAQRQASVLETMLLQRLHKGGSAGAHDTLQQQQQQQQLHASIDTDTSSLSIALAGADPDAAAAAVGLTKQQLQQLLQRPWQGAAGASKDAVQAAAAGAASAAAGVGAGQRPRRKQWQRPDSTADTAAAQPSAAAETGTAAAAHGYMESNANSDGEVNASSLAGSVAEGSDTDWSGDTDEASSESDDEDGSSTSRSSISSGSGSSSSSNDDNSRAEVQQRQDTAGRAAFSSGAAASPMQQRTASRPSLQTKAGGRSSSNGSSWPVMQVSLLASDSAVLTGRQQHLNSSSDVRPSPCKRRRLKQSSRSRSQPMQISTSLESAETLSVATTRHAAGFASQSSSLATAGSCLHCGSDAAACTCGCYEAAGTAKGHSRASGSSSGLQQRSSGSSRAAAAADRVRSSVETLGSSMCRRKLGLGPAAAAHAADAAAAPAGVVAGRQRQRVASTQEQQQQVRHVQQGSSNNPNPQAVQSNNPPAAAASAFDSDGELSSASDMACGSVVSAATGGTTLSRLAGVDLQTASLAKPRPAIVPRLPLAGTQQQQQQQQQQQPNVQDKHAAAAARPSSPSDKAGNRAVRMAQQCDMAPLMAQPGSSRNRGGVGTPRSHAGTPRRAASGTAAAAAGAAADAAPRQHSFTGGQQHQQRQQHGVTPCPAAAAAGCSAGSTEAPSPTNSGQSRRCSAAGSTTGGTAGGTAPSRAGSTSGGTSVVQYWGSSAGSYPASEEPSRQPTPVGELPVGYIYVPAAASLSTAGVFVVGGPAVAAAAAAGDAAGVAFGSLVMQPAAAAGGAGVAAAAVTEEPDAAAAAAEGHVPAVNDAASEGAASSSQALEFYHPVLNAQAAAQVLTIGTPRSTGTGTPRGLTPSSAAAAAASSYMTMRPAHMYKSVSTVYAMYSPLRGGLRALGQPKGAITGNIEGLTQQELGFGIAAAAGKVVITAAGVAVPGQFGVPDVTSGNSSEHHWHALLGTVPEEEGAAWVEAVHQQLLQQQQQQEEELIEAAAVLVGSPDRAAAAVLGSSTNSTPEEPRNSSSNTNSQQQHDGFDGLALAAAHNAALPTLQDFQQELQQEQMQWQQQQQQRAQEKQKDVVDRGPLFRPGSTSPVAARRSAVRVSRQLLRSMQQQQQRTSQPYSAAAATAGDSESDAGHGATSQAVGPLTASSPTRRRNGSSRADVGSSSNSAAFAATSLQQQQQRQQQQHREQHLLSSSGSRPTGASTAAVARVEAAAAAVAARVAAVAAHSNSRQQQHQDEASGDEQQEAAAVVAAERSASGSRSSRRRAREQWQQQRESGSRTPLSTSQRQLQARQRRQQAEADAAAAAAEAAAARSRRSSRSTAGGSSSSRRTSAVGMGHTPGSSSSHKAAAGAGSSPGGSQLVTSYHNPMVALEDAGLGAADEAALLNAGLVPGFGTAPLRRSCSPGSAEDGLTAAAVPAHVTPLARERCKGAAVHGHRTGAGRSVDGEQSSGAGGQLHWNPLYDPNAMGCSPFPGMMADR